ncbi:hypothetical protein PR048_012528 [Dryococelus australis]|uniref:Uncharacterized protein n=1 Tax=Dryococelus australis TaxID=614101 RepID=A0ABQ9HPR0_9NEOP|nr:hypothetical protein PR048_012528 [Dryococelus australis]
MATFQFKRASTASEFVTSSRMQGPLLLFEGVGKPDNSVMVPTPPSLFYADMRISTPWVKVERLLRGAITSPSPKIVRRSGKDETSGAYQWGLRIRWPRKSSSEDRYTLRFSAPRDPPPRYDGWATTSRCASPSSTASTMSSHDSSARSSRGRTPTSKRAIHGKITKSSSLRRYLKSWKGTLMVRDWLAGVTWSWSRTREGKAVIDFAGDSGPAAPIIADQQARPADVRRGARQTHPRRSEGKPSQTTNILFIWHRRGHANAADRVLASSKLNWFDSRRDCFLISAKGNRAGRLHWPMGFLGDLLFPRPLHFGSAAYSPRFTLIDSQLLDVNSSPNNFTSLRLDIVDKFMQPLRVKIVLQKNLTKKNILLASHQGEPGSIPSRITSGFSEVGIVLDDTAGRGLSRLSSVSLVLAFRRCLLHTHLTSPSPALKTSLLKSGQNTLLTYLLIKCKRLSAIAFACVDTYWSDLYIAVLIASEGEIRQRWSSARVQGLEETDHRWQVASSSTVPTCEYPGASRLGIEPPVCASGVCEMCGCFSSIYVPDLCCRGGSPERWPLDNLSLQTRKEYGATGYSVQWWGHVGVVVILLASNQGEPGSIPRGVAFQTVVCGNRAEPCHWLAGFLGDLPFTAPLHSGAAIHSPRFTLIGSQVPDVKSHPNLSI